MGVRAVMNIGNKDGASAVNILTGNATYPGNNQVGIVTMLPPSDFHRLSDINRTVKQILDYIRDEDRMVTAASMSFVTTLSTGKNGIREEAVVANIVTGDIAVIVVGSQRSQGNNSIFEEANNQLLDWMRENNRLVA